MEEAEDVKTVSEGPARGRKKSGGEGKNPKDERGGEKKGGGAMSLSRQFREKRQMKKMTEKGEN